MKVYVVLANAMGGTQYCGVFASQEEAEQHVAKGVLGKDPRIVGFDVAGALAEANVVYVAQTYSPSMDVHDFEGVYGNYENAKHASGHKGQAVKITL